MTTTAVEHIPGTLSALAAELHETRWTRHFTTTSEIVETDQFDARTDGQRSLILVTRAEKSLDAREVPEGTVGTIHNAYTGHSHMRRFLVSHFPELDRGVGSISAWGALVNPTPRDGHWYREFSTDGTEGKLLRWSDAAQLFTIMGGPGDTRWDYTNDVTARAAVPIYVEVKDPGVEAATPTAEAAVDVPANHNFFDRAELEPEGTPALVDREAEPNGALLLAADPAQPGVLFLVLKEGGGFRVQGYYTSSTQVFSHASAELPAEGNVRWARALVNTTPPSFGEGESWSSLLAKHRTAGQEAARLFERLNEACNEIAEDLDCCPVYEEVTEPLGFESRASKDRDWSVNVTGQAVLTLSGIPSRIDSKLDDEYGSIGFSVSGDVEVTTDFDITFTVCEQSSEESVRDTVDEDWVRNELDNILTGNATIDEIRDWRFYDVTEVD